MHEGGCLCGAVRYRTEGDPLRTTACHCTMCQRRWIRFEFCASCGTQVSWTLEALPGVRGIALGTLDDPKWPKLTRFSWFRSAHPWVTPPQGLEVVQKSTLPNSGQRP